MSIGHKVEEIESSRRTRKPWAGKIHNPRKLWEDEQAAKRTVTQGEFQKTTREGMENRFKSLEVKLSNFEQAMEAYVDRSIEKAIKKLLPDLQK